MDSMPTKKIIQKKCLINWFYILHIHALNTIIIVNEIQGRQRCGFPVNASPWMVPPFQAVRLISYLCKFMFGVKALLNK